MRLSTGRRGIRRIPPDGACIHGKKVRGIERSTFLVDATGKLAKEWRGVRVPGHVDEVLEAVKAL